jgi:hypothetical protein
MTKAPTRPESVTQPSKDDLIAATREMIVAYDATEAAQRNSARQIADNLAILRDRERMSQAEIGKRVDKAQQWVSAMLAWRAAGFPGDRPFAAQSKAARDRRNAEVRELQSAYQSTSNRPTVRLSNGEMLKSDGLSEAARRQIATVVAGNDADPEKSAADRKVDAERDKPSPTSTSSGSGGTKRPKKDSPEWLFNEAVYFDAHTMAKRDDVTFARVMKMFNDKRVERQQRKAAA